MLKARVFISCGQRNDHEKSFGNYLVDYFKKKGFETYFAEEIHDSKPLLLSILDALKESEYFVAFNPNREDSGDVGSIFVQQEIAVAASIQIPSLYFYSSGVDKLKGMSGGMHLNGVLIDKKEDLNAHLNSLTSSWDPSSKNQIILYNSGTHKDVAIINDPHRPLSNWFHISVRNESSARQAKNCRSYVESIKSLDTDSEITLKYKHELAWSGAGKDTVSITKKTERDFDAIWTEQGNHTWKFQTLNTSTLYVYPMIPDGKYEITYLVVCDNFPDARVKLTLELLNDQVIIISEEQL